MKFFFGIVFFAFVTFSNAEGAAKDIKPEVVQLNEAKLATNVRHRRGLLLSATPVVAAPLDAAPIASVAPVAVTAPIAYSYSASVPYPYAGYSAYDSYAPTVYL